MGRLRPVTCPTRRAFTLVELLVVISILGLLAALSIPALKNLGKSNQAISASRQLLDDVGRARQIAISQRTTVYMVFVPTNFWAGLDWNPSNFSPRQRQVVTNLVASQLTGYALISQGKLGDQPGQRAGNWQYQTDWQTLPENGFIAAWKFPFRNPNYYTGVNGGRFTINSFLRGAFPFPDETNAAVNLPYIAFNYLGQLTVDGINPSYQDELIPLAQGNVAYGLNGATKLPTFTIVNPADIVENPPGNSTNSMFTLIRVDALTGRARLEFQKLPQ